jgi:hypothetical protein
VSLDACGPLLNAAEMARLWDITVSQFYKLAKTGAFDVFKVTPSIGPRRYSKRLVERYLAGEPLRAELPKRFFTRAS